MGGWADGGTAASSKEAFPPVMRSSRGNRCRFMGASASCVACLSIMCGMPVYVATGQVENPRYCSTDYAVTSSGTLLDAEGEKGRNSPVFLHKTLVVLVDELIQLPSEAFFFAVTVVFVCGRSLHGFKRLLFGLIVFFEPIAPSAAQPENRKKSGVWQAQCFAKISLQAETYAYVFPQVHLPPSRTCLSCQLSSGAHPTQCFHTLNSPPWKRSSHSRRTHGTFGF